MYIRVRKSGDKPENDVVINISKIAKIKELRHMIFQELEVDLENQWLFYKGKQLNDDHCLMEYNIQLNDVILLMVKEKVLQEDSSKAVEVKTPDEVIESETVSEYYVVGDLIDMMDLNGAWFEGIIINIVTRGEELFFKVARQSEPEREPSDQKFETIRPRSYYKYKLSELLNDMLVLVNYNIDKPKIRGYWYDFKICEVKTNAVIGTLFFGTDRAPIDNCSVTLINEIYRIETPAVVSERNYDQNKLKDLPLRKVPVNCLKCKDGAGTCKVCGCRVCGGKDAWNKLLMCDECDDYYHIHCLKPPLERVPDDDEWYCSECKTDDSKIVKAGEKLKTSKKTVKAGTRDWGRGMACVGRTRECTIVPKNHIGPIPGVEVGTCWRYRQQVGEAGVHRHVVAGIHGSKCAYSIVLSAGYEDDVDKGDEFYYTGSGGRNLSNNKRVSKQSCDQVLTRGNKALALSCNAKLNSEKGAEAVDWKGGKPVRVVRGYKLAKHSKYAPKEGFRYDGIYKVVKYYPEKGKSGFVVWRYFLRRDDAEPAPWHKNGKELDVIYPPGYLEAQAIKLKSKAPSSRKRILEDTSNLLVTKKIKIEAFKLDKKLRDEINKDEVNEKLWDECKQSLKDGKSTFLRKVEELFTCVICQEVVHLPITTECKHNICKTCLKRSFSLENFSCPCCRFDLGKVFKFTDNDNLRLVLQSLFPGYETSR